MKKLIKFGMIAALALTSALSSKAQSTNLTILTSKPALRAYAAEKAATVWIQLSSSGQSGYPGNYGYSLATNHVSGDILAVITNNTLPISVVNTKDPVYESVNVVNSDGDQLFWGSSGNYPYQSSPGVFSLSKFQIQLTLGSSIPIKFDKPVSSAEFYFTDPATGQTVWSTYFGASGNKVYFDPNDCGDGLLTVTYKDGTQKTFDLRNNGAVVQSTQMYGQANQAAIQDMQSYKDPTTISDTILSYNGNGNNKTYELVMSKTNFVNISITTSEGAAPKGIYYRPAGAFNWQYTPQGSVPYVPVQFTPGVWYFVPDWDPSVFKDSDPYPWYYYGGKG